MAVYCVEFIYFSLWGQTYSIRSIALLTDAELSRSESRVMILRDIFLNGSWIKKGARVKTYTGKEQITDNLAGSVVSNALVGDDYANVLSGGAGDDTLVGLAGADQLSGRPGLDTADYSDSNVFSSEPSCSGFRIP